MYFKIQFRNLFEKKSAIDNVYFFDILAAKK